jgi:hypothetical protein
MGWGMTRGSNPKTGIYDGGMIDTDETDHIVTDYPPVQPSQGMQSYNGTLGANRHIVPAQNDVDNSPITFNRHATRWGDMQLSNGWQNTNYGKRLVYGTQGYLNEVVPIIPGMTRLYPAGFPRQGAAPSQWQANFNNGPGQQPNYPGGPGQVMGTQLVNPGSGG